jgi:hypothetical protein
MLFPGNGFVTQKLSRQITMKSSCHFSQFSQILSLLRHILIPLILTLYCTQLPQASQIEGYVTTDGQSASLSWNKAPIWGLRPDFHYS